MAHLVQMKETFEKMKVLLTNAQHEKKTRFSGDFKVKDIPLEQLAGFTKIFCFLCFPKNERKMGLCILHNYKKTW